MAASSADKFAFKQREELDRLIDGFEQDLEERVGELTRHFHGYADTILSMTGADDDQYVCERINAILRSRGLPHEARHESPP